MGELILYQPELDELGFRQRLLVDNIAIDNPSVGLFLRAGFRERLRNDKYILVEKEL